MMPQAQYEPPEIDAPPEELAPSWTIMRWIGLAALAAAIAAAAAGILMRQRQTDEVVRWTAAQAVPVVAVVTPQRDGKASMVILPGDIQAWFDAPIYARVSGYLKNWYFDYGARIKTRQLLADIDAPDLDAQLAAAQARLNSTDAVVKVRQAELDFAKTTYQRWLQSPKGVVSEQETLSKKGDFDSATARLNAAIADVAAAKGEVDRLQAFEVFKRITAPFDGVVTERNTDIGALINAGSGVAGGGGPVLFRVADVHRVRVFVQVPQRMSAGIHEGLTADLYLPQYPDKTFEAQVATTSQAINMSSRTLLVELHADNPDGVLQPGAYTEVHFKLPGHPEALILPASTLIFGHHGLQAAIVGPDDRIELKNLTVGRNFGSRIEVLTGLSASDRVVNTPPASIQNGDVVRLAADSTSIGKSDDGADSDKNTGSRATAAEPAETRPGEKAKQNDGGKAPKTSDSVPAR